MDSIGDFAENLILNQVENIAEGKELPPSAGGNGLAPAGRDISKVKVPDSFMTELLGEAYHPQDTPAVEKIPELVWTDPNDQEEPQAPQALTEETAQHLVPLLEEVKGLLKEMSAAMTSSGNIGVNMAGPQKGCGESWEKMEKGYGYINAKPAKTKKEVLKRAIRSKLKKR